MTRIMRDHELIIVEGQAGGVDSFAAIHYSNIDLKWFSVSIPEEKEPRRIGFGELAD
ncbi:MAG: hypothetical protein AAFQ17_03055 [Pseudomonadota bacterium]